MKDVFITAHNIYSPIGSNTAENFSQICKAVSGVKLHEDRNISDHPFYASLFNSKDLNAQSNPAFTKFETLLAASIKDALSNGNIDPANKKTVLIISSTKGNISLLETEKNDAALAEKISLHHSAKKIAAHFGFTENPIVVSNACISGLLAMIIGMRFIRSDQYDHAVIAGADVISKFVLSGFESFQAISKEPCKPFDESRTGINLGEAAGTIILSSDKNFSKGIKIAGGSISNDANHISGPSRTGEELYQAISNAMKDAALTEKDIDFISAHGTATLYNDEMESKAINLAGLQHVPVNSLKGYYGHTLGAAGLIESIVCIYSLTKNLMIPTKGFNKLGVTQAVNVSNELQQMPLKNCLKTASGFGGCNAAVILVKE